jgi:hypothetical protein
MSTPIYRPSRGVDLRFMIDTNRINARQADAHMNQLEKWHADDVIMIELTQAVIEECPPEEIPNTNSGRAKRAQKARVHVCALTGMDSIVGNDPKLREIHQLMSSPEAQARQEEIATIIFGASLGCLDQNSRNDVRIVYAAGHYGTPLITADGDSQNQPRGILGSRDELRKIGIVVMRASEAVALVRKGISDRDAQVRLANEKLQQALPEWVGQD